MAYLFVFFTEEDKKDGEQIYFAVSKDGLHWTDLKNDGPILKSTVGDQGVRDPFILYNPINDKFFIIATDLRIANGKGWKHANINGNKSIIVWESPNLYEWNNAERIELVEMEAIYAGCVWAPEATFDEDNKKFVMYWASLIDGKQKMYAADTVDFHHFTNYRLFMESDEHIIDTTIVKEQGYFYRFSVNYGGIGMDRVDSLYPPTNCEGKIKSIIPAKGMEGGIILYFNSIQKWCLFADNSSKKKGYVPLVCSDLDSCNFEELPSSYYDFGKRLKRHGSILPISENEYDKLMSHFGVMEDAL